MRKLLWLFLLPVQAFAANFYVSNSGSDAAAGTIGAPWASIARVNAATFAAGDTVFFQCGGTFFGTLRIRNNGVVVTSYGTGNKPILTGFHTITSWTAAGTNLWTATIPMMISDVKNMNHYIMASRFSISNAVSINGRMAQKGRFPNKGTAADGWAAYTNSFTGTPANVTSSISLPAIFTGGELVARKRNWVIDVLEITRQSGNTITVNNTTNQYTNGTAGRGFFVQGHIATLDQDNEWHLNNSNKLFTLYSLTNPSTKTVRVPIIDTLVTLGASSSVTLDNLDIQGGGTYGVFGTGSNVTIRNCNIRNISYWGIELSGGNAVISNNLIRDIGSNGIWLTGANTLTANNQLRNIGTFEGYGGSSDYQYIAIKINNSGTIRNNVIDSIGYHGIHMDANSVTIRENFVQNIGYSKADVGGIYSWDGFGATIRSNRIIRRNVVINLGRNLGGLGGSDSLQVYGVYMDGGSNNVIIDSNVVGNLNPGAYKRPGLRENIAAMMTNNGKFLTITNNIFYGFPNAMTIEKALNAPAPEPTNNVITGNAFYVDSFNQNLSENNQGTVWWYYKPDLNSTVLSAVIPFIQGIGTINNNFYASRANTRAFSWWTCCPFNNPTNMNLAEWKAFLGTVDQNSTAMPSGQGTIITNGTASPTTYTFTGLQKKDFKGNTYNNSATIAPYYGNIFFDNGPAGANPPTVSCNATTISCNGGSATVTVTGSGGTPPLSGTGTFTRTAGTYTFTVTDANGQTGSCNVTITQPTALVASNTAGTITTVGGSANIVVTASGGTAPYSGTGTFSRTAGTYTFTVTDANGCTATTTRTLTNPSPVVVTCSSTQINCNGGTSTITVSASGGTGPYLNTGSFIRSAGAYTFSVTDAVGATGSCSLTITEPAVLVASATAGTISSVGSSTSVVVTASGGVAPYTGTGTFTRGAGIHTFTVTDANGCTSFVIVSLNDPVIVAPQTLRINNIRFTNGN